MDALKYASDLEATQHYCTTIICDLSDGLDLESWLEPPYLPFDACIHFAAESHVDNSISNPGVFVQSNIVGTFNLLECVRRGYINKLVHVSTDEVYGDLQPGDPPFSNPNIFNPSSPYSATKAAADMLVMSYIRTYGIDASIVRMSNNYGPHQYEEKLIPVIIDKASKDQKIPVYGTGKNMREWIYVEDACKAIDDVLNLGKLGEVYNIGSGFEIENLDLVKKILDLMGKPESLISFVEDRKGHDMRYFLDSSKIRNELGWKPEVSFEEGIQRTIDFYLEV